MSVSSQETRPSRQEQLTNAGTRHYYERVAQERLAKLQPVMMQSVRSESEWRGGTGKQESFQGIGATAGSPRLSKIY